MGFESIFKLSVILNMVDRLSSPLRQAQNSSSEFVNKMQKASGMFSNMAQAGAVMTALGAEITTGVLAPVEATFATRKAIGELSSLGVRDLGLIEEASKSFSNTWAGTAKSDFITAAYDIKSGIASLSDEGVAQYTELAGLTAKATKSTIAEMTDLFATGYGIYKDYYSGMTDMEFGEIFSAGISKSVQQFKTDGSQMAAAIKTLGASATTAQIPLEEQLSVMGMLQATMSGSEAGTKYKAFLRSAVKGGEALGLSFMDANNQLLNMPEILGLLKGKFGETMDAAEKMELQTAFGDAEAVALIDLMYNKTGALQDNILALYDSMGQGTGVAQGMANAINETEPDKYQRLQQQIQNVKESIGNSLLPTVNEFLSKSGEILTKVDSWVANNQELVRVIMMVVIALGGILVVGGGTITVIGGIGLIFTKTAGLVGSFVTVAKRLPDLFDTIKIYGMYAWDGIKNLGAGIVSFGRQALTTATTALAPLITSVWSFTAALLANPITWIVIGIVALIAGIVLLYNKCEWFRNLVDSILSWISEKLSAAFEVVSGVFKGIGNVIGSVMGAAKESVTQNLDNMKQAYESHGGGIKGVAAAAMEGVKGIYTSGYNFLDNLTGGKLSDMSGKFKEGLEKVKDGIKNSFSWFKESGKKILTTFTDGIKATITAPVKAVKDGLQKIRDMLPFSDAKTGPLDSLTLSGSRVMSTLSTGIRQTEDMPAEAVEIGFHKIDLSASNKNLYSEKKAVGKSERIVSDQEENNIGSADRKMGNVIQNLNLHVDFNKIKELPKLFRLIEEMEEYTNNRGGGSEGISEIVLA